MAEHSQTCVLQSPSVKRTSNSAASTACPAAAANCTGSSSGFRSLPSAENISKFAGASGPGADFEALAPSGRRNILSAARFADIRAQALSSAMKTAAGIAERMVSNSCRFARSLSSLSRSAVSTFLRSVISVCTPCHTVSPFAVRLGRDCKRIQRKAPSGRRMGTSIWKTDKSRALARSASTSAGIYSGDIWPCRVAGSRKTSSSFTPFICSIPALTYSKRGVPFASCT